MTEKIKTLLLSKNEADNRIGIILHKQNCVDWFQFFGELNEIVGYTSRFYKIYNGGRERFNFKYDEDIADVPFKEEI